MPYGFQYRQIPTSVPREYVPSAVAQPLRAQPVQVRLSDGKNKSLLLSQLARRNFLFHLDRP